MSKKILIIGFGSIGQRYFKIIRKNFPKIKIGIYSSKNTIQISKYKIKNIISFNPDLTIFCSPASKRLKIFKQLKKTRTNILFEKPLVDNFKNSKIIKSDISKKYYVGYNLRQLKILHKFKKLIDDKLIGKIYSFHIEAGQYLPFWRKKNYDKSVTAKKNLGGGVILELSHEIDYSIFLFGKISKIKSIYGKQSNLNINTEDFAKIILLTKNKIIGSIFLDCLTHDQKRFCHVIGSKGELYLDILNSRIKVRLNSQNKWKTLYKNKEKINQTYLKQIHEILKKKAENDKNNKLISIKSAKYILKIIEMIKK